MLKIKVTEFVHRLVDGLQNQQHTVTWFLGAGCSISSGIPGTGALVERWLRELHEMQPNPRPSLAEWAKSRIKHYDSKRPGASYAEAFRLRHHTPAARQHEVERICRDGDPGYGYATFAQLLSLESEGRHCNTILTTNFDDLVADALYIYGERRARPQIITHDALIRYARLRSPRPLIVKLHGDAHFEPRNLQNETAAISAEVAKHLQPLVMESVLVFIGYGGNDESISQFLCDCPDHALAREVYWIGLGPPGAKLSEWLERRDAIHVEHRDFDELMHLLRGALDIAHPSDDRWTKHRKRYFDSYEAFEKKLGASSENTETTKELRAATQRGADSLPPAFTFVIRALAVEESDPDLAEQQYQRGIAAHPASSDLLGMYARFLQTKRQDLDGAEAHYRRAVEADPKDANSLGNYANFLWEVRQDLDGAEAHYRRAVEADPKDANSLGNYATLLWRVRQDMDGAEAHYRRAVEADPNHANNLGNYATFLREVRQHLDGAEVHYRRAVEADPKDANTLGNYANFLREVRQDMDGAEVHYRRALEAHPKDPGHLGNYATLLWRVRQDMDGAEAHYRRALEADPKNASNLGNYATFLREVRQDLDGAEAHYRRAVEADPNHANNLGNYASFLLSAGRSEGGKTCLMLALRVAEPGPLRAELLFYTFAHRLCEVSVVLGQIKGQVDNGIRTGDWDFRPNIERARLDGHPELRLLEALADVLGEKRLADILDAFPTWRAAVPAAYDPSKLHL